MKLGSLFAGIGGFELAATWAGIEPVWSNEIEPFACKVLRKNFNHEIIQKDIREIGSQNLQPIDIISGGFPCQPFSSAGKRKGKDDDRYLWPEMLRVIRELKPSYVIGENVAGLLGMENGKTLERILDGLENEGYRNEVFVIPACGVGAWHKRDRVWIVSHSKRTRLEHTREQRGVEQESKKMGEERNKSSVASKDIRGSSVGGKRRGRPQDSWSVESELGRVANGIPNRVDRLKGLGNAIVPQVAYELFKAIKEADENL